MALYAGRVTGASSVATTSTNAITTYEHDLYRRQCRRSDEDFNRSGFGKSRKTRSKEQGEKQNEGHAPRLRWDIRQGEYSHGRQKRSKNDEDTFDQSFDPFV